jgi:aspartate/methionine/tyrosine aminotransferase
MAAQAPRVAHRVQHIAPFHVMELVKRANALAAAGHPVIQMNIGEPDFTAAPAVVKALAQAAHAGLSQYTPALGITPLREAIARDYHDRFGLDIDPSRIIITAGASAALSLACTALVNPGDRVLLTDPSYPCNRHFVAAVDGIPDAVPVGPATAFQMTRETLEKNWCVDTVGALLASPANPTGTSIAHEELGEIIQAVRQRGGFCIVDEIYLGLTYDTAPRSALSWGDDIIVTNSFSKYYSMTGWRLGWLVVPPELVATFEKLSQNLFICASALAQRAALACFTPESREIFEMQRHSFRQRRDFIVPALRQAGLSVPVTPDGAFYVWIDCSAHSDDSSEFAKALLERAHVSIVPGQDFGIHESQRYLRLSYATRQDLLEQAVERIANFLRRS